MAGYESTPTRRGTMKKKSAGKKKTAMSKGTKRVASKKMNYGY